MNREDLRRFLKAIDFLLSLGVEAEVEVRISKRPFYIQNEGLKFLKYEDIKCLNTLGFEFESEILLGYGK